MICTWTYTPKDKAHNTLDDVVPLVPKICNIRKKSFMINNEHVINEAYDRLVFFLENIEIPGHDVRVDHKKLHAKLTQYIYKKS